MKSLSQYTIITKDSSFVFFFFNDTATTEIYTLSLHDALPISIVCVTTATFGEPSRSASVNPLPRDRKSTRLNSSHLVISYAVFCLKKKNNHILHASLILPVLHVLCARMLMVHFFLTTTPFTVS